MGEAFNPEEIKDIVTERFTKWQPAFIEKPALPLVVVGLLASKETLDLADAVYINRIDGITPHQLTALLQKALKGAKQLEKNTKEKKQ